MLSFAGPPSFGSPPNASNRDLLSSQTAGSAAADSTAPTSGANSTAPTPRRRNLASRSAATFDQIIRAMASSNSQKPPLSAKKPPAEDDNSAKPVLSFGNGLIRSANEPTDGKDSSSTRSPDAAKGNDTPRTAKTRPADADVADKTVTAVRFGLTQQGEIAQFQNQTGNRTLPNADIGEGSAQRQPSASPQQLPEDELGGTPPAGNAESGKASAPSPAHLPCAGQPAAGLDGAAVPAAEEGNTAALSLATANQALYSDNSSTIVAKTANQMIASVRPENGKDAGSKENADGGVREESARTATPLSGAVVERSAQTPGNSLGASGASSSAAEQVAKQIISRAETITREGSTELTMHLEPGNLGAVRIHLTVSDDTISGRIVVQEAMTQHLLEQQMASLRQSLTEAGVHLGGFNVRQESGSWQEQSQQSRPEALEESSMPRLHSSGQLIRKEPNRNIRAGQIDVVA